jgi:NDP-sugar pyrophosphorylase family protein
MTETAENPTPVVILAGGRSRRLRPLSEEAPKPMLPIGGKPFLQVLMERLAGLGLRRFILAVCFRWEAIRDFFGDGSAFGWSVEYSVEPRPLGTGGAVLHAQKLWGARALVLNGDTYLAGDWPAMLAAHEAAALPVTMALVWSERPERFGRVLLEAGRVVEFLEKQGGGGPADWVNGGAYVLEASALADYRPGQAFSLERDVFPSLGGRIAAFPCRDAAFADIGTVESLEAFRRSQDGPDGTARPRT